MVSSQYESYEDDDDDDDEGELAVISAEGRLQDQNPPGDNGNNLYDDDS